jgi:L-ascorbate metabolism protein UlaG (beta-lactamase superfamily)
MSLVSRLAALALCAAAFAAPASAGLTVTALDHAGFMFSDGKTKILVDALLEPSSQYPFKTPAPDLLGKMENGKAPFDGVTLLLISHDHIDHYSPAATVKFLAGHPKALVVTTAEVLERLKTVAGFDAVATRVVAPDLAWKQAVTKDFNGVTLEIDRLKHGDDKKWACQLDAFVFTLGGKKVLYATATSGVFPEEYKDLGYAGRGFDLAFVNYYMAIKAAKGEAPATLRPEGVAQIRDLIGAKTTVLIHIEADKEASVAAVMGDLAKALPGATWFRTELESRDY